MFKKNKYRKLGFSRSQVARFRRMNFTQETEVKFGSKQIKITNPYWFLHSIDELFIDQLYKFESSVTNPFIFDCGANWGLSLIFFKQLYPNSEIIAYEPDPEIFKILTENISRHNFRGIQLENKAVWKADTELTFAPDGGLGGSIKELGIKRKREIKIQAIRLKNELTRYEAIEFLKMDIEGAEYEVLNDCKNNLSHVQNMFVEYHSIRGQTQQLDQILLIVKEAGFRYYIKEAWNNMPHPFTANKDISYDLQLNIFCYRV